MAAEILLVGSIPYDTNEKVFREFGPALASSLVAMPDGEVGPRSHWISRVHYAVFANHPDLETVRQPAKEGGVERLHPRDAGDSWQFKVRDGIETVAFGDKGWRLGYARDAINSYFIFKALRAEGLYPAGMRFQVSVPSVNSAVPYRIFPDQDDVEKVRRGYVEALKAELETIVRHIPAHDLAIQLDCASEVQDAYGAIAGQPAATAIDRNTPQIQALLSWIPHEVMVGFHMCFGTLGGWPRFEPEDISGAVMMANAFIRAAARPVGWIHIPLLARTDEAFYAPLRELQPNGARVFLGMVHSMESYPARLAIVRKLVPDFGVAAYCGFGRLNPSQLPAIRQQHLDALRLLHG
ncbi:hypothetical protein [Methylocella sp. CPCC 101449]|jgi:hypothetical protein|uniref:hypothetical protein n=1 Tax=Methylocella sp. CPCC 101449 TaxID=2987531 RepID=UPI00288EEA22|nr:hypothetical protein [Methylocella sp. CPCC 101449]MDT2021274.1 hypothetical protein [Methylocella sp. CPCC 101449]HEV2571365.1 hypothetical protein [Beijerinckiaceae bacterium]